MSLGLKPDLYVLQTPVEDTIMISLSDLRKFKAEGRKFSCLTCYDASMAKAMEL